MRAALASKHTGPEWGLTESGTGGQKCDGQPNALLENGKHVTHKLTTPKAALMADVSKSLTVLLSS